MDFSLISVSILYLLLLTHSSFFFYIIMIFFSKYIPFDDKLIPGQSRPVLNGRASFNYDENRQSFTLTFYSVHIRCFTVY